MALDGYNWGTIREWSTWQTFTGVFKTSYDEIIGISNKPVMIAETASTEEGGDKAAWIRSAFLTEVPSQSFPRIAAINWFNANKETNWRIDSTPTPDDTYSAANDAHREVARDLLYQSNLP